MALQQDRLEELRQGGTIAAPAATRSLSSSGARSSEGRNGSGQLGAPVGFPDSLPPKREGSRGHIRKAPPVLPVPDSLPITIPQGLKKLLHSPPTGRTSFSSGLESPRVRNEEELQRVEGEEQELGEKKKRSRKRDKVKSVFGLSSSKKRTAEKVQEEVQATETEPSVSQERPIREGEDRAALQDRLFLSAIEDTQEGIKRFAKSVKMMGRFLEQRKFDIEEEKTSLASDRPAPVGSSTQDIDLGLMVVENNRLANSVRARLQELQSIVDIQDHPGLKKSHQAVLNAVLTQFVHQIELYNRIQLEHRNRCRDRFARTATIVMPDVTEEQLEELLDTGAVKDVIYDRIMADQRQAEARKALFLMQEQRRDLRDLEKNLTDLQQLFLDVYSLLGTQEDTLRALNTELEEAKPRILETLYELKDAEKAAIERRRWQRNMYATVAGVGLVMVAITLAPLLALA